MRVEIAEKIIVDRAKIEALVKGNNLFQDYYTKLQRKKSENQLSGYYKALRETQIHNQKLMMALIVLSILAASSVHCALQYVKLSICDNDNRDTHHSSIIDHINNIFCSIYLPLCMMVFSPLASLTTFYAGITLFYKKEPEEPLLGNQSSAHFYTNIMDAIETIIKNNDIKNIDITIPNHLICLITQSLVMSPCRIVEKQNGDKGHYSTQIYEHVYLKHWLDERSIIPHANEQFDPEKFKIEIDYDTMNEVQMFLLGILEKIDDAQLSLPNAELKRAMQ